MVQSPRQPGASPGLGTHGAPRLVAPTPAILWAVDRELRCTTVAGAGLATLGLDPGQVVGRTLAEAFRTAGPAFPPLLAAQRALIGESTTCAVSWAGRAFQCHVEPLRDSTGAILGSTGVALDVSAAQHATLPGGEERYRALVVAAQRQAREQARGRAWATCTTSGCPR